MLKQVCVAAVLAFGLTSGVASAVTLDCAINAGASQNGFITDRYIFEVDEKAGTATALDGLIQHETGGPVAAKLATNANKIGMSWSVKIKTTTGQTIRMQYRASYFKANKTMNINVIPGGGEYSGGFDARGTCVRK